MNKLPEQKFQAELLMPSTDLAADIFFFEKLGFRLDQIFPSEDPVVARMSGLGMLLRLDRAADIAPPVLHLLTDEPDTPDLEAPNGCIVKFEASGFAPHQPATIHKFELRELKDGAPWVIGRAGMHYRDLIPDRLGGSIIASHIRIPDAGPVPDVVHYHTIGFQLIYCYKGWVKLVYEDQGPPFILEAGDCVTQPPQIRHRVLEASENLEVIEIGVPADHMTTVDHEMELPTPQLRPERAFGGQVFCHHRQSVAQWEKDASIGFEFRDTGVIRATRGLADVKVLKPIAPFMSCPQQHQADIFFTFVLEGEANLNAAEAEYKIRAGDAFVVPPEFPYTLSAPSGNLELLQVSLR